VDGFSRLARYFKGAYPSVRLSIRRCVMPSGTSADCRKMKDGTYRIRISRDVDATAQEVLLIHELAHAISWDIDTHKSDHGPKFGIAYAKVWRSFLELLEKN